MHPTTRKHLACLVLLATPFILAAAPTAVEASPTVRGTSPKDGGKLVGNTVVFVGYDLVPRASPLPVQVEDLTTKTAAPHRVTHKCKPAGKHQRCAVTVILTKRVIGHRYRVSLHDHPITFTCVAGDPGKSLEPPKAKAGEGRAKAKSAKKGKGKQR